MNESGDRYTLCVKTEEELIPIAKFTIKEIDNITMNFNNSDELFTYIIENQTNFEINFVDKAKLDKLTKPSIYKDFTLEHKYKGSKYTDVLYKEDKNFNEVRRCVFDELKTSRKYLEEVLFSSYNRSILENKKSTCEILKTTLMNINTKNPRVEEERIQDNIDFLYEGIYYVPNTKKIDYIISRTNYIDTMKFIKKYDLYGKLNNYFEHAQLKAKEIYKKVSPEINEQLEIDFNRYR